MDEERLYTRIVAYQRNIWTIIKIHRTMSEGGGPEGVHGVEHNFNKYQAHALDAEMVLRVKTEKKAK